MTGMIGIVVMVVAVVVVLRLVLQRRLLVKYAGLWIAVALALMVLAVVPGLLPGLADFLGFEVPANLLFSVATGLLLAICLQLSFEITRVERRLYRLAEEVALERARSEESVAELRRELTAKIRAQES